MNGWKESPLSERICISHLPVGDDTLLIVKKILLIENLFSVHRSFSYKVLKKKDKAQTKELQKTSPIG